MEGIPADDFAGRLVIIVYPAGRLPSAA